MNKRKAAGTSRKGKGTVTEKALARSAKTAYDPSKKKKTMVGQEINMPGHVDKKDKNKNKNKNLAAMYGDPNKVTRGDVIAAAIKNKKKKNTLVG